jgi:hypothetical protein
MTENCHRKRHFFLDARVPNVYRGGRAGRGIALIPVFPEKFQGVLMMKRLIVAGLFLAGCNNGSGGGTAKPEPEVSPSGRVYPKVIGQGKFERSKEVNPSNQSKHSCSRYEETSKIDSRFKVGTSYLVLETQSSIAGGKTSVKKLITITSVTDSKMTYTDKIIETTGENWEQPGQVYESVCERGKANNENKNPAFGCKRDRVSGPPSNHLHHGVHEHCSVKNSDIGKSGSFLQASDGVFTLAAGNSKKIESEIYGFNEAGDVECLEKSGKGKGTMVTVAIRSAAHPSVFYPSMSRDSCGGQIYWSRTVILADGTVVDEETEELIDIDPL